ncbi:TPA: DEAD/DEAH box helicase [Photobacterium damselae]
MSFSKLGLSDPIVQAVTELGYNEPTPIQNKAIPVILLGKDVLAAAQTGTGKTASFVLPMLERFNDGVKVRPKRVRGLILAPTRELVAQVAENIEKYSKHLNIKTLAMFGGVEYKHQKQALIEGVDILVATPGRLLDMCTQRAIHLDEVETVVLDEADRMLDMGFIEAINKVMDRLPLDCQQLLFSATMTRQVRELARTAIENPIELSEISKGNAAASKIEQWLVTVDKDMKSSLLSHMIKENDWDQALIFIETKHGAAKLVEQLAKRDIYAEAFHSSRSQAVRSQLLEDFKSGQLKLMVATGVAARGIDIDNLKRVINYDLPYPAEEYIHRIGRTGRAGASGEAISFVSKDNFKNLCMIESRLGHLLERRVVEGFEPRKPVPVSILNYKPKHLRDGGTAPKEGKKAIPHNRTRRHNKRNKPQKSKPE